MSLGGWNLEISTGDSDLWYWLEASISPAIVGGRLVLFALWWDTAEKVFICWHSQLIRSSSCSSDSWLFDSFSFCRCFLSFSVACYHLFLSECGSTCQKQENQKLVWYGWFYERLYNLSMIVPGSGVDIEVSSVLYVSVSHANSSSLSSSLVKTTALIDLKSGSDIYVDNPPTFPSASVVVCVYCEWANISMLTR